ncbi:MAG: hypothetical protein WDW38_003949 [Sanguina aurantia]
MLRSTILHINPVRLPAATVPGASPARQSALSGILPDCLNTQLLASLSAKGYRTSRCAASPEKDGQVADAGGSSGSSASTSGSEQHAGKVTITHRGTQVLARAGSKLRTALLRGGVSPHNGQAQVINCRGLGTCGTCAVEIAQGHVQPPEWSAGERLRLNFLPHSFPNNQRLRLACQVSCESDLEVEKYDGFWGQGSTPRGPIQEGEIREQPLLGELEFVMDAKERMKSTGRD